MNKSNDDQSLFLVFLRLNDLMIGICGTSLLFSLLSLSVLTNRTKLNHLIYRYLLVSSASDVLYHLLVLFTLLFNSFMLLDNDHFPNRLFLVICSFLNEYITPCLSLFNVTLEIFITRQRIAAITEPGSILRQFKVRNVCLACLTLSCLVHLPILFMYEIDLNHHHHHGTKSSLRRSKFGQSDLSTYFMNFLIFTRLTLATIVLFILNTVAIIKFRRFTRRSRGLKARFKFINLRLITRRISLENAQRLIRERNSQDQTATKRTTIQLIALTFIYIFSNLPAAVTLAQDWTENSAHLVDFLSHLFLLSQPVFKFIVFLSFNKQFRHVFYNHKKKILTLFKINGMAIE